MKTYILPLSAALLAALSACHSAYETARDLDTAEAYRSFLRDHPQDPSAEAARSRLSELEFLEARRQHTLPAYKRFLTAFPEAPRARDAQLLIEGIRFETAAAKDTSEAWLAFLRDHSQGSHAKEARKRLEDADYRALGSEASAKDIRLFLGRHPSTERRSALEKRLDELDFQEAGAAGTKGLLAYLESNPVGAHRNEVRGTIFAREALAFSALGDFEEARRRAERIVQDDVRTEVLARIGQEELDWLTAELDPKALDGLLARIRDSHEDNPLEPQVRERKALLSRQGPAALQKLRESVDPLFYARPTEELLEVLKSADPRERWQAAAELGRTADSKVIRPLLAEASKSRFSRVRQAAFDALREIFRILPQDTIELTIRTAVTDLEKKAAQDAGMFTRLGIIRELTGEPDKALVAYESALRLVPDDTFVLRRLVALNADAKKSFRAGVLARELAFRVRHHAEQWTSPDTEGANARLLARTLCGTLDDARFALERLKGLPPAALADLADDVPRFISLAEESVQFVSARLADAEAEARSNDKTFIPCAAAGEQEERLKEGEGRRIEAVADISRRKDELRTILLKRMAARDPSEAVRSAAAQALQGISDSSAESAQGLKPAGKAGAP